MRQRLRASAALAAAALVLHQLRYLAGHGDEAGEALAREGHGYLAFATPLVAMLLALALVELGRAWQRRQPPARATPLRRRWTATALALVAIYVVQESLEGALTAGHPAGLAGIVGAGGWVALPLAAVLGLCVALLLGSVDALLLLRSRKARRLPRPSSCAPPPVHNWRPARAPLARNLAGRSPPLASC